MEKSETSSPRRRKGRARFSFGFSLAFVFVFVLFVTALAKFALDNYESDLMFKKKKRFMMGRYKCCKELKEILFHDYASTARALEPQTMEDLNLCNCCERLCKK